MKNVGFLALAFAIALLAWVFFHYLGKWAFLFMGAVALWALLRNQKSPRLSKR